MKTCPCCKRSYVTGPMEALAPPEAQWSALPFVGNQPSEDESGQYNAELRNCPCGSTIAVETKIGEDEC